jgi:hypothetical protein
MNPYAHVADMTRTVHDGLIGWGRRMLQEADLETVEVYGQFPPEGTVSSHMVLFPYWVGPTPKMVEQGSPVSLLRQIKYGDGKINFIPEGWRELGTTLGRFVDSYFTVPGPLTTVRIRDYPHPRLDKLPKPLAGWFLDMEKERKKKDPDGRPWVLEHDGKQYAPPPALMWKPGIHLVIRYIAVASDPGRGTSDYSSTAAPLALPALSVLATGVHKERRLKVTVNPPPMPPSLESFIAAMLKVAKGDEKKQLQDLDARLCAPEEIGIAIAPVDDLNNQEFALLMQALQRPLQAALNFQLRIVLGAHPDFEPGTIVRARSPRQSRGFNADDGSG